MKNLLKIIEALDKVDVVKKSTTPSLDDEIIYNKFSVIIKTKRNLFDWAKSLYITPSETAGMYNVQVLVNDNPNKGLLKDLYNKHKTQDWVEASYGHDKTWMHVLVGVDEIKEANQLDVFINQLIAMNKTLIFQVGDKFIRVSDTSMKSILVKDINRASTFRDMRSAKSWEDHFKAKYPKAELKEAQVILKLIN